MSETLTYRPPFAIHVRGEFDERRVEDGMPVEQTVKVWCEWPGCNGYWQTRCASGRVRAHIQRYASQHLHRDPMAPIPR